MINQRVRVPLLYRRPTRRRVLTRSNGIAVRIRNAEHGNPILVRDDQNTGTRQRCLENLRPWSKGTSGNPAGRPKDSFLSEERREFLAGILSEEEYDRLTGVIIKKMFERALDGDVRANIEIFNRVEGRVRRNRSLQERNATAYDSLSSHKARRPEIQFTVTTRANRQEDNKMAKKTIKRLKKSPKIEASKTPRKLGVG